MNLDIDKILIAVDRLGVGLGRPSTLREDGTGVGGLSFTYDEVTAITSFINAVLAGAAEGLRAEAKNSADWDTEHVLNEAADLVESAQGDDTDGE